MTVLKINALKNKFGLLNKYSKKIHNLEKKSERKTHC